MSDQRSAEVFDLVFTECAKHGKAGRLIAESLWDASWDYDFSHFELEDHDALVTLGLAKRTEDGGILFRTRNRKGGR